MRSHKIKFAKRAIIFIVISFFVALVLESLVRNKFRKKNELDAYLAKDSISIIYFGDSVIKYIAKNDTDERSIGKILSDLIDRDIGVISDGAYHLGVYEAFSEYLCSRKNTIETVIIPINLRSFSVQWERPSYEFKKEIDILLSLSKGKRTVVNDLMIKIRDLFDAKQADNETEKWENLVVFYDYTAIGTVKDYILKKDPEDFEDIRSQYIFRYLYNLDKNHRKINSLKSLIANYEKCGISVILYITPVNYKLGEKYVGENFSKIVSKNISIIIESVNESNNNVLIENLAFDLEPSYFDHLNAPNEHLNERGRKYVAERLGELLLITTGDGNGGMKD